MASFTTAAKDEILSNRAVRQHFRDQQSFGLMVFSREFSAAKMQMLTRERRAAQYYAQLVQSVRPLAGTVTLREEYALEVNPEAAETATDAEKYAIVARDTSAREIHLSVSSLHFL